MRLVLTTIKGFLFILNLPILGLKYLDVWYAQKHNFFIKEALVTTLKINMGDQASMGTLRVSILAELSYFTIILCCYCACIISGIDYYKIVGVTGLIAVMNVAMVKLIIYLGR